MQALPESTTITLTGEPARDVRELALQYEYLTQDIVVTSLKMAMEAVTAKRQISELPSGQQPLAFESDHPEKRQILQVSYYGDVLPWATIPEPGKAGADADITVSKTSEPVKRFSLNGQAEEQKGVVPVRARIPEELAEELSSFSREHGYDVPELTRLGIRIIAGALHAHERFEDTSMTGGLIVADESRRRIAKLMVPPMQRAPAESEAVRDNSSQTGRTQLAASQPERAGRS